MPVADFISMLSFTENRAVRVTATTEPDLVSPAGHPNAVRGVAVRNGKEKECDCYPWGGATVATAGIVKVATVRGVVDFHYEDSVNAQRMKEGNTDADGRGGFKGGAAPREWVKNAEGTRIALKRNQDGSRLYVPVSVMASEAYEYRTLDGTVIDPGVVHPFVRERDDAERQGVSEAIIVRDYRLDRVMRLEVGKRIADGKRATEFAAALRDGDAATARRLFAELIG